MLVLLLGYHARTRNVAGMEHGRDPFALAFERIPRGSRRAVFRHCCEAYRASGSFGLCSPASSGGSSRDAVIEDRLLCVQLNLPDAFGTFLLPLRHRKLPSRHSALR